MNKAQIKKITSEIHPVCLIGMQGFDEDIQQFTCKCFRPECGCYKQYKNHLDAANLTPFNHERKR